MEVVGRGYVWVQQEQCIWLGELELLQEGLKIMKWKISYISAAYMSSTCCSREPLVDVPFPVGSLVGLIRTVLEMQNSFEM